MGQPIELGNSLTLLRHKFTGDVYATNQFRLGGNTHRALNFTSGQFCYLPCDQITTEHYDVIDEAIVRGFRIGPMEPPANTEAVTP